MAALAGICLAVFPYAAPVKAERVPIRPGGIAVKMKLLGVVAACALALTAGAANADTFTISGTFGPGIITVCHLSGCDKIQAADAPLSGTVTIASGVLTNINLTTLFLSFDSVFNSSLSNVSSDGQSWTLDTFLNFGGVSGAQLRFSDSNGILTAGTLYNWEQGPHSSDTVVRSYSNLTGTGTVIVTPIPGALPLFATGLGVLGLLGWRRKRKLLQTVRPPR